jgi:hypothetical protein
VTVIARGAKQVAEVEKALGGRPPKEAIRRSQGDLRRHFTDYSKQRARALGEAAKRLEPGRELALAHLDQEDPRLKKQRAAAESLHKRESRRKLKPPKPRDVEPTITIGSIQTVKGPPYDAPWTSSPAGDTTESANHVTGAYDISANSFGDGGRFAGAGIGLWFFAPADNAAQRVAALLDFSDYWLDSAEWYVAHNDLRTRIWVWGHTEGGWVGRTDVSPSWTDGVGWLETHGNDPGEDGTISIEAFFPCRARRWYFVWLWSALSIYADSGIGGTAISSARMAGTVQLVVFGSL